MQRNKTRRRLLEPFSFQVVSFEGIRHAHLETQKSKRIELSSVLHLQVFFFNLTHANKLSMSVKLRPKQKYMWRKNLRTQSNIQPTLVQPIRRTPRLHIFGVGVVGRSSSQCSPQVRRNVNASELFQFGG